MARFLITIDNGEGVERLQVDLASREHARREATIAAAEIIADRPDALLRTHGWRMVVTDEAKETVMTLKVTVS